jgi:hypothetical protein
MEVLAANLLWRPVTRTVIFDSAQQGATRTESRLTQTLLYPQQRHPDRHPNHKFMRRCAGLSGRVIALGSEPES